MQHRERRLTCRLKKRVKGMTASKLPYRYYRMARLHAPKSVALSMKRASSTTTLSW